MAFELYRDAVLARDIPEQGVFAGDVGTVVEKHEVAGREPGYSLEIFDLLGNTVAVIVVGESDLRPPTPNDRLAVRREPVVAGV